MQKDERDLLDVLKFELNFLEKGGYGRSSREALAAGACLRRLSHVHELRLQERPGALQRLRADAAGAARASLRENTLPANST